MTADEWRDFLHLMEKHRQAYSEKDDIEPSLKSKCLAGLDEEIAAIREEVQTLGPMH